MKHFRNAKRRYHACVGQVQRPGNDGECSTCKDIPRPWMVDGEEWRLVQLPGVSNYLASSHGRVKHKSPGRSPRIPQMRKCGYVRITLFDDAERIRSFDIQQLVAAAFHGPPPPGYQVDHLDGDRLNNRPSNLEYVTTTENVHRTLRKGTHYNCRLGYRMKEPANK